MVDKSFLRRQRNYDVIENLNYNQIKFDANEDLIEYIDSEVDAFIKSNRKRQFQHTCYCKEDLNIVSHPTEHRLPLFLKLFKRWDTQISSR
jgi:uncharacterized protein with gpF-like domain